MSNKTQENSLEYYFDSIKKVLDFGVSKGLYNNMETVSNVFLQFGMIRQKFEEKDGLIEAQRSAIDSLNEMNEALNETNEKLTKRVKEAENELEKLKITKGDGLELQPQEN